MIDGTLTGYQTSISFAPGCRMNQINKVCHTLVLRSRSHLLKPSCTLYQSLRHHRCRQVPGLLWTSKYLRCLGEQSTNSLTECVQIAPLESPAER